VVWLRARFDDLAAGRIPRWEWQVGSVVCLQPPREREAKFADRQRATAQRMRCAGAYRRRGVLCVLSKFYGQATKSMRGDALAQRGDEGRGQLRNASGRSKHSVIRGCPNGETRWVRTPIILC
jgi:hypothetical protein